MNNSGIKSIAASAVNSDGSIKPFAEQLKLFSYGEIPSAQRLLVCALSVDVNIPVKGELPLLITQGALNHIKTDHKIRMSDLEMLPQWLKCSPLAFDSVLWDDSLVMVIDEVDSENREITIPIHLNRKKGELFINEIPSAYGWRDLQHFINRSVECGATLYVNERTSDWLTRTRVKLPQYAVSRLLNTNFSTKHDFVAIEDSATCLATGNRIKDIVHYKNITTKKRLSLRGIILEPNHYSDLDNFSTAKQTVQGARHGKIK